MNETPRAVRAWSPGRVNLIGDHTDYMGGLAMPMAIPLGITIEATWSDKWNLVSTRGGEPLVGTAGQMDPDSIPAWARYVTAVADELVAIGAVPADRGLFGTVRSTLPSGVGLSSSAALETAAAIALGVTGMSAFDLALVCQRAELAASGVPCGVMDQWAVAGGRDGFAMEMNFASQTCVYIPIPVDVTISIVHSGDERWLGTGEYEVRRSQCEAAESIIGPLNAAQVAECDRIEDPVIRRRARHVISECARVRQFGAHLRGGERLAAGHVMFESHRSLSEDFDVSTPKIDALVNALSAADEVFGARITGAGFGGCVVVAHEPTARIEDVLSSYAPAGMHLGSSWTVRPANGAIAT